MRNIKNQVAILLFLACYNVLSAQTNVRADEIVSIEYIDLIHCTHTDYGYTDHPVIIEELQQKFLDIAIDAASATSHLHPDQQFYWTAEALDVVWNWWKNASPDRRSELISLINKGQIDISAIPYNFHPLLNDRQWDLVFEWIPEDLWAAFKPEVGIQHDVNGFSRASAIRLLDKGVKYIWNGINTYWGGAPFSQPMGFWWQMPDGRKILVWQSLPYWYGYNLFTQEDWRHSQPNASNTQFRTPRINDILQADEQSVRKAHKICTEKIKRMQQEGYNYDFITLSITNQWRIDNDGPFPPVNDFINKWNELNLKPALRLCTAKDAMARIENRAGMKLSVYTGEWPDWWAFGAAAAPRELAASRYAGNIVKATLSPVWGNNSQAVLNKVNEIERSLCRFYEHTFAANKATSDPFGFFNQGHLAEKSIYAYRPYEQSKWLLAQRIRNLITNQPEGLYVVNTGNCQYTGWIELDKIAFRKTEYRSASDPESGHSEKLLVDDQKAKFWVTNLDANSYKRFQLSEDTVKDEILTSGPEIEVDNTGWPHSIQWKGMDQALFIGDIGKFFSLESTVERRIEPLIWNEKDSLKRMENVGQYTKQILSIINEKAQIKINSHSIIYAQNFEHPRLKKGKRIIEIWQNEARVSVDIQFYRVSSNTPEIFYVEFPLPQLDSYPVTSNGGEVFRPYIDQIPGTCTDFFTIDAWVKYPTQNGDWLWSGRDAALVSFSGPQLAAKRLSPPQNMNRILAMVYNNMWEVNFLHDCPGDMLFHFDLIWKDKTISTTEASNVTRTYNLPPAVMLNPGTREDPFTFKRLNEIK